jgi:glycosyltransferase involved in cell wall biosynthesis
MPTAGHAPRGTRQRRSPSGRRPPRILHLTREYPPVVWGGLGTAVGGLATASAQGGLTVGVMLVGVAGYESYGHIVPTGQTPADLQQTVMQPTGVQIFPIGWSDAAARAVALVREWQPDVVHIHPVELWPIARVIQAEVGTPLVYTVHSINLAEYAIGEEPPEILNLWRTQEQLIGAADRVIVISRSEAALLAGYYPAATTRIRIIGNGIHDRPLPSRPPKHDGEPLTVLYTGRFVERKGIRDLLNAVPMVLQQAPETRFVLVGGYGSGQDVERDWLPPALNHIRSQLHFTGWLGPTETAHWYDAADLLAVPSWYEPFGMVILEGMLHGLAITATAVGGPAEILTHQQTGLLVPPKDPRALAHALLRLIHDADTRRRIAHAAATEVRRTWLWPRIVHHVRTVYEELCR